MDIQLFEYILGGVLAVLAVALIFIIGKQQGKRRGLGNSIAGQGASESYINKNKIGNKDKVYQRATLITAIVFVVLVIALYVGGTIDTTGDTSDASSVTTSESAN